MFEFDNYLFRFRIDLIVTFKQMNIDLLEII